jgi:xylulokinase
VGAGALKPGDAVDGLGTVECITTVFSEKTNNNEMGKQGYPCIPYAVDGLYCTYILNFSCGSIINWFRKKIMHAYKGDEADFFTYVEKDMPNDPTGILVLPYFGGAATPYQDISARGNIWGLTTETSDSELYKALMEGLAMEMRLNAETVKDYSIELSNLIATGGGANSKKWLQIKADIQKLPIKILRSSEGGLCGCAMLSAVGMGAVKSLEEAKEMFVKYTDEFFPREEAHEKYESQYENYKKLYKITKELY